MNIIELKKLKQKTEREIKNSIQKKIQKLQNETGLFVKDVKLVITLPHPLNMNTIVETCQIELDFGL